MTHEEIGEAVHRACVQLTERANHGNVPIQSVYPAFVAVAQELVARAYEEVERAMETVDSRCHACLGHDEHDVCEVPAVEQYVAAVHALRDSLAREGAEVKG
jgi:hypothetical protein